MVGMGGGGMVGMGGGGMVGMGGGGYGRDGRRRVW